QYQAWRSVLSFSSRRRHTSFSRDWSSDVCSSDLILLRVDVGVQRSPEHSELPPEVAHRCAVVTAGGEESPRGGDHVLPGVPGRRHQRWSYRTTTRSVLGCAWHVRT